MEAELHNKDTRMRALNAGEMNSRGQLVQHRAMLIKDGVSQPEAFLCY